MSSIHRSLRRVAALGCLTLFLSGCGSMADDLNPSGEDKRPAVTAGETGSLPGQICPDITLPTTAGESFRLSDHLASGASPAKAVVFYFTMWCPVCWEHMDRIQFDVVPRYEGQGKVLFVAVDYVNGSVAQALQSQTESGFTGGPFIVGVDLDGTAETLLRGTMATAVVVDGDGVVRMNEDFKTGEKLIATLDQILSTP